MNHPDFTVVRATTCHKVTGEAIPAILVKVDGTWTPPGEETWWVENDEELYARFHVVEILAKAVDGG